MTFEDAAFVAVYLAASAIALTITGNADPTVIGVLQATIKTTILAVVAFGGFYLLKNLCQSSQSITNSEDENGN